MTCLLTEDISQRIAETSDGFIAQVAFSTAGAPGTVPRELVSAVRIDFRQRRRGAALMLLAERTLIEFTVLE